ncbi:MAG TPA: hypothetical protein VLR47_09960 [Rhodospirillales bacterium]|nr:hypothetical protein [Rhodospirillales bacterium]
MKASAKSGLITTEDAYAMGYRHIFDLAQINQIAELVRGEHPDGEALRLLTAWREGAMVAQAMIDRARTTLQ